MRPLGLGWGGTLLLAGACTLGGCDSSDDGDSARTDVETATETNVTRLACTDDGECLMGETCVFADADAGVGQCSGDGQIATSACVSDDECALGESCTDGECRTPSGSAAGTCLAGDPDCADLGPADQPTGGAAGGTCLAGDPNCADLGPADQPAGGAAGGTCLAGDPSCAGLGPADERL